jgi:hypothetical protein
VSKAVKSSIFLGAATVKWSVERLLNTPPNLSAEDPIPLITSIGFTCSDDRKCIYTGTASSIFIYPGGGNRVRMKKRVRLTLDPNIKPFVVQVSEERLDF